MGLLSMLRAWVRTPKGRAPRVDAREADRLRRERGALVVDVREPFEFRRGHVPGAVNIPLGEVADRLDEVPRDRPVIVHCALGARSTRAAALLQDAGVADVRDMAGGIVEWRREGLETEKD